MIVIIHYKKKGSKVSHLLSRLAMAFGIFVLMFIPTFGVAYTRGELRELGNVILTLLFAIPRIAVDACHCAMVSTAPGGPCLMTALALCLAAIQIRPVRRMLRLP